MTGPTVLAATWSDGVFVIAGETRQQGLAAQSVDALKPDSQIGTLALSLMERHCANTRLRVLVKHDCNPR